MTEERKHEHICSQLIMSLNAARPLSDKERKLDLAYGFVLVTLLVLVPIIAIPLLMTFDKPVTAAVVTGVSFALFLIIGLSRRKHIFNMFPMMPDAHKMLDIRELGPSAEKLASISPFLMYAAPMMECYQDLLYNWLCWRHLAEPGDRIIVWHATGEQLAPYFGIESQPDIDVLLVPIGNKEPDDWNRLEVEMDVLGIRLLKTEDTDIRE